jgi:Carboxypeptidase regulatory-like domain
VAGPKLDSRDIRFALLPGATISGVVTDEANEGVRNATVRLFRKDLQAGRSATRMQDQTTSDDEGRYRFARLESGVYFIGVEAHPWYAENDTPSLGGSGVVDGPSADRFSRTREAAAENPALDVIYEDTYFSNANRVEEASPLRVGPGDRAIADVALYPIPALHLLVRTGGSGNAVLVHAESGSYARGGLHKAVSGESGVAEFGGLKPGLVTVFLDPAEERGKIQTRSLVLSSDAEVDSEVFSDGVMISGVVKMNDHSALPARVSLGLRRLENPQAQPVANVGDNGEFDFGHSGLTKGVYDIFAFEPSGAAVVSLSANGASVAGQELIVGAEKEVRLTVTIAIGAARVGGVAEKDGQPLEGAMMLLVPLDFGGDASLYRRDQSDSDGTFGFESVVPGNYVAVGIEDGWGLEWSQPEVIQKYLARGTKVMVGRDGVGDLKVAVQ